MRPQSPTVILRVKESVRARDGYRCTKCGLTQAEHVAMTGRRLDVHRVTPGSVYTPEGCVTLCRDCHRTEPKRAAGQPDLAACGRLVRVSGSRTLARVERQARRHGLNASSYIRLATSERLERDEATDPAIKKNKGI
jgi:hypothetical protein